MLDEQETSSDFGSFISEVRDIVNGSYEDRAGCEESRRSEECGEVTMGRLV